MRRSDPEHRRQELVEAATAVFIRQGYASTRVADIATAAGVAKGTVYEYFPSKEEVFLAVFASVNEGITRRIEEVDEEALRRFARRLLISKPSLAALGPLGKLEPLDRLAERLQ